MKKLIAMILSLVLVLSLLTSCGSEPNEVVDDGLSSVETKEEYDLIIAYWENGESNALDHQMKIVGDKFAEEQGVRVKYITFRGSSTLNDLDVMLMAQNTDVDVFYAGVLDVAKYIRMGYFVDLSQYDNLKAKIESNTLVKYISEFDGKYFGIPSYPRYNDESMFMYISPKFITYCFENVDGFAGTYSDPEGEELYEVFKYIYEHDGDRVELPLKEVDYSYADCNSYTMMSPFSKHKDTAALYLEYLFDYLKTAEPVPYPDVGDIDLSGTYLTWRSTHYKVVEPLFVAYNDELMSCDGSEKALRELAEDAARGVRMRLEG